MMNNEKIGRTGSPPFLYLTDSFGFFGDLGEIKTGGKYRKEIIETIKINLSQWMSNNDFEAIRNSQLDLAIVIKLSAKRLKRQDIDNVAKVICDALKKQKDDSRYLFNDDSQLIRLLIWKIKKRTILYGILTVMIFPLGFMIQQNR